MSGAHPDLSGGYSDMSLATLTWLPQSGCQMNPCQDWFMVSRPVIKELQGTWSGPSWATETPARWGPGLQAEANSPSWLGQRRRSYDVEEHPACTWPLGLWLNSWVYAA